MDTTWPETRRVGVAGRALGRRAHAKFCERSCVFVRVSVGMFVCVCLFVRLSVVVCMCGRRGGGDKLRTTTEKSTGAEAYIKGAPYMSSHNNTHRSAMTFHSTKFANLGVCGGVCFSVCFRPRTIPIILIPHAQWLAV